MDGYEHDIYLVKTYRNYCRLRAPVLVMKPYVVSRIPNWPCQVLAPTLRILPGFTIPVALYRKHANR